ncbi:MAG: glycosyltransferase family 39 protein [Nakamurella sp.]
MVVAEAPLRRTARPAASDMLLVGVGLVPVAGYLLTALRRVGYPYELSYFEGSTVEVTARVVAGGSLYGPPSTEFTPWPYPPLFFWLGAAVSDVTGLNISALRWVSVIASIVVLVLIAAIVRQVGGSIVAGTVAAGLYAASYPVSGAWADTARVDSLLLAALLAAVFAGLRARSAAGGLLVGVLLFAAFLSKQNAVLVAGPLLLWLLMHRRRAGLAGTACFVGLLVVSTVVADGLTGGWYSASVFGQLVGQPWALQWLAGFWLLDILLPFCIAIAVGCWAVRRFGLKLPGGQRWWRRSGDTSYLLAGVLGLLLAALSGRIHDGGYANVAMPAHAGVAICFGVLLAKARRSAAFTDRMALSVAAVLALQYAFMSLWGWDVQPSGADQRAGNAFIAAVQQLPGQVLIPSHPYYLRLAGGPAGASAIAVRDALLSHGKMRDATQAILPCKLTGIDSVILDNLDQAALFGTELTRDFTLVDTAFVPDGALVQVTDEPSRPSLLYLRTSVLQGR